MPSPEQDALAAVQNPDGPTDWDGYKPEYERALAARQERLSKDARAVLRALDGWSTIKDADDWQASVRKAAEDVDNSSFLIERLGAERYLDPELMAVLLVLRRRLIEEHQANTAAELMLIDSAVLAYYHQLRINGWIGSLSQWLEAEFFRNQSLTAKLKSHYGTDNVRGLRVEDIVQRLAEQMLPLLDRANRLMLRNLKALHSLKQPAAPQVNIGAAGQVNIADLQINAAPDGHVDELSPPY